MYDVRLTGSYFPAQADQPILETTVGGILRAAAAAWPRAVALVEADASGALGREWTYAALLDECERLSAALLSRYAPGERVAVWAPNLPEWVIVEFAAALGGLVLVTVNPAYQARELRFVLEQSRASGLIMAREHRGNPMWHIAGEVRPGLPGLREVVDIADRAALFAIGPRVGSAPPIDPGDATQIQYTSGTTGFPKGALLTHRGLTNNARLVFARGGVKPGSTVLNFMPMFHTSGCAALTLGPVQLGCRIIIARLFDAAAMNAIIEAEPIETLLGVPTMLVAMLEAQAARPRDVSSVKLAISGGAMVPPEVIRNVMRVFGCDFQIVYGETEASPVVTQTAADDALADKLETVGQPLAQTEVSVRDPGSNAIVPVGTVGEICARGYGVMIGYNDDPAATAAAIDAEGWLHTGDLGAMDERGYVRVTGRVKEMIIRGGENLFPAEIENVLLEHPDVAEVAVVGLPDERWGETVACFVRLVEGARLDPAALAGHCRARLAPQKTPKTWIAVGEWPLTGSGKIQKFVLRERYLAGEWTGEGI